MILIYSDSSYHLLTRQQIYIVIKRITQTPSGKILSTFLWSLVRCASIVGVLDMKSSGTPDLAIKQWLPWEPPVALGGYPRSQLI